MARFVAGLILAVLTLFPSSSVSADPGVLIGEQFSRHTEKDKSVRTYQALESAARRFEKHIFVGQDGLLFVNIQTGEEAGISEEWYQFFKTALETTNRQLQRGTVQVEGIYLIDGTHNVFGREAVPNFTTQNHVQCAGRSGVEITWMGPRYYFDDCQTHLIAATLGAGAAVGTLCTLIADVPCTILAGVAGLGAASIYVLDELGGHHGIYVQYDWTRRIVYTWHQ